MRCVVQRANSRVNEPHDTTQGLEILANSMANTNLLPPFL